MPNESNDFTLIAELSENDAAESISQAVKGRRAAARQYLLWLRKHKPEASPIELVAMLEKQYLTAISVARGLVAAGSIAIEIAISLMPGGSVASTASKNVAKATAKTAMKGMAHSLAVDVDHKGVAKFLPAGDEQLQFELTSLFALALADLPSMDLTPEKSKALVYVSLKQWNRSETNR